MPVPHHSVFFTGWMLSCHPINSMKALKIMVQWRSWCCYVIAKRFVEQGLLRRRACSPLMINRLCCIGFGSCSFVARSFTSPAVMARACRYRRWSNDYSVTVVTVSVAAVVIITSHRASTSTRWHFAFALCCHGNETRAPIANPPNSAQLGGTSYHSPSYIQVRAVVRECGEPQTQRQTRVTTIHFTSSTTRAKCN